MKNILFALILLAAATSCGNNGSSTDVRSDTSASPSDTTGLHVNPALEDPNSNMADTMKMKDSGTLRDTSRRDRTSTPKSR